MTLMKPITPKTIAKAYIILVLLLAALFSPLPQLGIALGLLAIQLYSAYKPLRANLDLAVVISTLLFMPLGLEALAGQLYAVLLTLPALLLLDQSLRENAYNQTMTFRNVGRSATSTIKSVATGLLLTFAASIILFNKTLILADAVLLGYFAAVLVYSLRKMPKTPLHETKTWNRILAGNTDNETTILKTNSKLPMHVSLKPAEAWIHVTPSTVLLSVGGEAKVNLRFTPPLAGPAKLQLQAVAIDSRGLIQTNQILEPIELHIIPRAKYAQWLAHKYLGQTSPGTAVATATPPRRPMAVKRGVEYHGSRPYQHGDRMKDIDWKHSYLFWELIVKEFAGAQGQPVIIVADLTAKDAQDADKLAYNIVKSALTLATESLPSALAVYNQNQVITATAPTNPRETLKKALALTKEITIIEPSQRVLQPTQIRKFKRSISQLDQMETESAHKLKEVLELEFEANLQAAKEHPATQALTRAVQGTQAPAVITVASSVEYNSEALLFTLERLKDKGYSTVLVA